MDFLRSKEMFKRNVKCGEISENEIGKTVIVNGWIHRKRDLGGLLFIDLRDRSGIVQVVVDPKNISKEKSEEIQGLKNESVVGIEGKVKNRLEPNLNLPTGKFEILLQAFEIFSKSENLPFNQFSSQEVDETVRLKYRYLDLRRPEIRKVFELRSRIIQAIRTFFINRDFIEIETPILTKSTPEGARDFIVPSRLNKGKFYALPQSPQLFKQILMIGGFEKYFQIARCFRDEDLRQDRQPEFTQLDVEMSFIEQGDILKLMEEMYKDLFKEILVVEIEIPFQRVSYVDAKKKFGSDKPDTRFGMEIKDLTDYFKDSKVQIIRNGVENGKSVLALFLPDGAELSRKEIDDLKEQMTDFGLNGFIDFKIKKGEIISSFSKYLTEKEKSGILGTGQPDNLALIFVVNSKNGFDQVGRARILLAEKYNLVKKDKFNFIWVVDFPFFAYNEEEGRYEAEHHPFTMPKPEDLEKLETDKEHVKALAYDLVLNGNELGGGSIRIHNPELQKRVFKAIGLSDVEVEQKFGFLVQALSYGAPPHGGIAFGLDRLVWIMNGGTGSLRDVIAFPKTTSGICPLTEAPNEVSKKQLNDVGIKTENG
jgi:aspartyl-tRNA synthetase